MQLKSPPAEGEIAESSSPMLLAPERPVEILLVDDSRVNLMAAEKHGWHVLWFDDYRPDESSKRVRDALEPTTAHKTS